MRQRSHFLFRLLPHPPKARITSRPQPRDMTMPANERDDELRYAMNQLEAWLVRWRAGQAPNGVQLAAIRRAVGELHIDEGEVHDDAEASAHHEIADLLAAADRDMELLRPKYEYLSGLGGRPVGHA
jgi:hypothetical protein